MKDELSELREDRLALFVALAWVKVKHPSVYRGLIAYLRSTAAQPGPKGEGAGRALQLLGSRSHDSTAPLEPGA